MQPRHTRILCGARAITRRLVERHGFTIVAVEGDWPDAAAYHRFRGQKPPEGAQPPFQRFPTWMWRNTVMPPFLRDLRTINTDLPEGRKAGFYGLDIYNMSGSIEAILVDPTRTIRRPLRSRASVMAASIPGSPIRRSMAGWRCAEVSPNARRQ